MATLVYICRITRPKWYFTAQYPDKELRARRPFRYGFEIWGRLHHFGGINLYFNRYALYVDFGRTY